MNFAGNAGHGRNVHLSVTLGTLRLRRIGVSTRPLERASPANIVEKALSVSARVANPPQRLTDRRVFFLLSTLTLCSAVAAQWLTSSIDPLRGDSAEYLYFDPSRTVGYPAFLALVRLLTGHVGVAVAAQTWLLAGSLLLLGWTFHQLVRRPVYSIGFQLLILANAGMWFSSAFLMTEALSTALVAFWCAQLLRMIKKPRGGSYGTLVAISAIGTMVRPSLVALFFGTALFALTAENPRHCLKALALSAAGLVSAWAATPISQLLAHGSLHTTSPLARGVLQHTLYCDPRSVPKDGDSAFVERSAEPVRHYINAAPADMQEQFRREYSTPLRFGLIIPVLGRRHGLETRSEVDPYLARIADERVLAAPACYARSVANEYLRLAAFDTDPSAEDARAVNAFAKRHPPVEVAEYPVLSGDDRLARRAAAEIRNSPAGLNPARQQFHVVGGVPFLALLPLRLLHAAAALVGAISLLALLFRQRLAREIQPAIVPVAAMGAALHGILAITAIVEIGFFRYLVPCWPLVCTVTAVAALTAGRVKRSRSSATVGRAVAIETA